MRKPVDEPKKSKSKGYKYLASLVLRAIFLMLTIFSSTILLTPSTKEIQIPTLNTTSTAIHEPSNSPSKMVPTPSSMSAQDPMIWELLGAVCAIVCLREATALLKGLLYPPESLARLFREEFDRM